MQLRALITLTPAAAGSFAQVYRTNWHGKDVAVKKLKENMFEAEAGGMSELDRWLPASKCALQLAY